MSKLMDSIIAKAKANNKHIVLAEGEEPRIIAAAETIVAEKIARLTLLGNKDKILSLSSAEKLAGVNIIDPTNCAELKDYANLLFELRKAKGMTEEKALVMAQDPLFFGCLMIKSGAADGMVAGSINSTGNVLRAALQVIRTKPGVKTVSSCFVMDMPEGSQYGENGVMIFGDSAVLPCPTAEQMVDIATASVDSARKIAGIKEPKVALLSFSTKGSAKHELVDKIQLATKLLGESNPDFAYDGELQLDAAIVPSVGELKAPGSPVAGHANVLIFPDLQAGNIGYKLVQRFGMADAIGPICQGFNAPVNDLSRGCSAEDVVSVVAITSIQ
ncbi:MAG: phosphate acetyltransferase [Bacillota bacterium]